MASPDPQRVVRAYTRLQSNPRGKTAGEVRFIKDRSSDKNEWGWGTPGPSAREIHENFVFKVKYLKPLAQVLRSLLMALGHATSAHSRFVKVKSRNVSPDGSLGGKGYIQKIPEMRRQLMNVIEVLSATSDTLYDELKAPHWQSGPDTGNREREKVEEILEDASEIKEDPESWAEDQEEEMEGEMEEEMEEENEGATRGKTDSGPRTIQAMQETLETFTLSAQERIRMLKLGTGAEDLGLLKLQVKAKDLRVLASKVSMDSREILRRTAFAERVASCCLETHNV